MTEPLDQIRPAGGQLDKREASAEGHDLSGKNLAKAPARTRQRLNNWLLRLFKVLAFVDGKSA